MKIGKLDSSLAQQLTGLVRSTTPTFKLPRNLPRGRKLCVMFAGEPVVPIGTFRTPNGTAGLLVKHSTKAVRLNGELTHISHLALNGSNGIEFLKCDGFEDGAIQLARDI